MNIEQSAAKLSRNPLGIIALFILLIYGLATTLFGCVGSSLTEGQKWWFVIFLVIFPIIVLASFVYLVVKHHPKLYAPGDFRDESNFFGYQSPKELMEKYKNDSTCFLGSVASRNLTDNPEQQHLEIIPKEQTEKQLNQGNTIEKTVVCQSAEELRPHERLSLERIEKLALNCYEKIHNVEIERHVYFMVNKNKICFDGFQEREDRLRFFQVLYLPKEIPLDSDTLASIKRCIEDLASNVLRVKEYMLNCGKYPNYKYSLNILMAIETDNIQEKAKMVNKIRNVIDIESIPVIIRGFRISMLEHMAKDNNKSNAEAL